MLSASAFWFHGFLRGFTLQPLRVPGDDLLALPVSPSLVEPRAETTETACREVTRVAAGVLEHPAE
jgi:hypothetical protein